MPSFSPTFIKVDPVTGLTFYDFDGHIRARGLDLTAGSSASPPDDRKIRWLRESDGAVSAQVFGYTQGTDYAVMNLEATLNSETEYANVSAVAQSAANPNAPSLIQVAVADGTGRTQIKTLIDSRGISDFVLGNIKIYGPFLTSAFASIAPDAEHTDTVTHNLGITRTQVVVGHLIDGFGAAEFGWRAAPGANSVDIVMRNNGPNNVNAQLRFCILGF